MTANQTASQLAGENIFRSASLSRPSRWRKKLALVLAALLIFAAGGVIGASLAFMHFRSSLFNPGDPAERISQIIAGRVSEAVTLTVAEKSELERVVKEDVSGVESLRRRYEVEARRRLSGLQERMCAVLGPERSARCGDWLQRLGGDK
ncbi:MAG: hypothetical protein LBV15_00310, partial [Planctomycetota bacterium]|nr:hypothetical protein [Planctomycetota bacterium]